MKRRQQGVALVLVLWVVTLLAVIGGNFAFSMRGEAQIARNLLNAAQLQAQADAGQRLAWFELLKPASEPQRWQGDGMLHEFASASTVVRVSIVDESGKINLNTAPDALLSGLFRSAGMTEEATASLLNAVLDWRTSGNIKRLGGAKEQEYLAAGKNYGPPNAPFETVDELQRVLGMTSEIFRKIAPALTIYSRQPGLHPMFAPREALLAIPGINPAAVEQFLVQRQQAAANGQPAPVLAGSAGFLSVSSGGSAYTVRSEATAPDGASFLRIAVVKPGTDQKRPISVLTWGEGEARPMPATGTIAPRN